MSDPRFSVIIPTRQRHETLRHSLRTCLAQQHDSFEVIVCDNFSSPETREVVEEAAHPRLRYVRSEQPLAMSANWELAISHARGEFIIFIGDDDGLLLHALPAIDRLLRLTGTRALRWERVSYSWPDDLREYGRNGLTIPLGKQDRLVDGNAMIRDVLELRADYTLLPMLYNAAIHRDLVTTLRDRTGGVFKCAIPDVYTGITFAWLAGNFASTSMTLGINGASGKSNGVAHIAKKGKSEIAQEFERLNAGGKLDYSPLAPNVPVISSCIAESFAKAQALLFPDDPSLAADWRLLFRDMVQRLTADSAADWSRYLSVIEKAAVAHGAPFHAWYRETLASTPPRLAGTEPPPRVQCGLGRGVLRLDASRFGVTDVFGAAQLAEKVMSFSEADVVWRPVVKSNSWSTRLLTARDALLGRRPQGAHRP